MVANLFITHYISINLPTNVIKWVNIISIIKKVVSAVELIARSYVSAWCQWINIASVSRLLIIRLGRLLRAQVWHNVLVNDRVITGGTGEGGGGYTYKLCIDHYMVSTTITTIKVYETIDFDFRLLICKRDDINIKFWKIEFGWIKMYDRNIATRKKNHNNYNYYVAHV